MPSGGARSRSGPPPDPSSERSERRGVSFTALPAEGFSGEVPPWPLPRLDVAEGADRVAARELELWEWAWRTPQACAWATPAEVWRSQFVARWVRQAVVCESVGAKAGDHAQLHRYADEIGLTTAGLRLMGWKVAVDEVAAKASTPAARAERRLRPVDAQ